MNLVGVSSLSIDYFEVENPKKTDQNFEKKMKKMNNFKFLFFSSKFDEFRTKNDFFQTRVG